MSKEFPSDPRPRRYHLLLPLKVWVRSWGKAKVVPQGGTEVEEETTTQNISSSGCYFLLSEEPRVGSAVDMEIQMAPGPGARGEGKILCRGRVVRVNKEQGNDKTGVGCVIERYSIVP